MCTDYDSVDVRADVQNAGRLRREAGALHVVAGGLRTAEEHLQADDGLRLLGGESEQKSLSPLGLPKRLAQSEGNAFEFLLVGLCLHEEQQPERRVVNLHRVTS